MKIQVTETEVRCDACQKTIEQPLAVAGKVYSRVIILGGKDFCVNCAANLLQSFFRSKKVTEKDIEEVIENWHIVPQQPGVILC